MFERFTKDARSVVNLAVGDGEATGTVDSVSLLLALAWQDPGDGGAAAAVLRDAGLDRARLEAAAATVDRPDRPTADVSDGPGSADPDLDAEALASLGIDLDAIRARADDVFGPGALDTPVVAEGRRGRGRRPRFSPDAKKTLELALREAVRLRDRQITSAHLLLGVLRDPASPAARTLVAAGADLPALRASAEQTCDAEAA
ncbi:Clp protease N-terminal domain-containing protein [Luteimicrobium sp. NPDC057192]|uniref:Clp protease N-terminal domain-containing protein n=1 Tax=Luteimicrobium sp. NPDC057192 TaxID=3346042 RepID=UPI0036289EE7